MNLARSLRWVLAIAVATAGGGAIAEDTLKLAIERPVAGYLR